MNASFAPGLGPRDSHTLWYTPPSTFTFSPLPRPPNSHNPDDRFSQHPNAQGQNQSSRPRPIGLTPLEQLELDEQSIALRKLNIQRFGATWIRPPGMAKTYQGELDEKAEREEAEAQEMLDEATNNPGEDFELDDDGLAGRDLDANIPEGEDASDLDVDVREGESFMDGGEDEEEDEGVDLDAEIPEGDEAETLWDDSDVEDEDRDDDEDGYQDEDEGDLSGYGPAAADANSGSVTSSTRESVGGDERSPQRAIFSHDESYPDERRRHVREAYDWRGNDRYRRDVYRMEVDSD